MESFTRSERLLFTSESVSEAHPDKICDQISDAVLDAILADDPDARVACETATTTGTVLVCGEITTSAYVDVNRIVRDVVRDVGGDIQIGGVACGGAAREMEIGWSGPYASGIALSCNGWVAVCVVTDMPSGSCTARGVGRGGFDNNAGYCVAIGAGNGRCRSLLPTEDDL